MELVAGNTFWDKTLDSACRFEKLEENLETDILIVGGGITGALCAFMLSSLGMSVTLLEKNRIGCGSSSAHTGLLMYKSDKMLFEMADDMGEEKAVKFYKMCLEAMDQLSSINSQLDQAAEYRARDSIYYATSEEDRDKLRREYGYLSRHGFPAEYLSGEELKKRYGIDRPCAIRTWHDADVNPYKFANALVKNSISRRVRFYENSEVDLEKIQGNSASTKDGFTIKFNRIVLATGYSKLYPAVRDKCIVNRTYAFASEPSAKKLWEDEVMVWETRTPYIYFRATEDHRIIGGGMDEETDALEKDAGKIAAKAEAIAREIETIFPRLDIKVSHAWDAIFVRSKDGLPFIGEDPEHSGLYYLLGYEGNGTCYSMAGSLIIRDLILGISNPYSDIVRVDR